MIGTMEMEPKADPAEVIRVGIFMTREFRDALKSEALARGIDMSDLAVEIMAPALADEIARMRKKRQADKRKSDK